MLKKITATETPGAWVANSKDSGRKAIKNGSTYLKDNEEFKIELYNPLQRCVLAVIKLNGDNISKSGLVLNPGQRFYLDCFIEDNRKFIFKTYEVDNTNQSLNAIKNNGLLEVDFYEEKVILQTYPYLRQNNNYPGWDNYYNHGDTNITCLSNASNYNMTSTTGEVTSYMNKRSIASKRSKSVNEVQINDENKIETGRVTKGVVSDQKFDSIDMQFNHYKISSTIINLLPESRRPKEIKEIKKNSSDQPIDILFKLGELNKLGIIDDNEFNQKKAELLSRI